MKIKLSTPETKKAPNTTASWAPARVANRENYCEAFKEYSCKTGKFTYTIHLYRSLNVKTTFPDSYPLPVNL